LRIFLSAESLGIKGSNHMAKKRKTKKAKIKRKRKRSTRKGGVLTPIVSDDALERAYSF